MKVFIRLVLRDIKRLLKSIIGKGYVYSWERFHKDVRLKGCNLLKYLDRYQEPVLVSGCQRSGTTALARLISESDGMVGHWKTHDDELDGAILLSGLVENPLQGRYCFQTTYLNECYTEYFDTNTDFRLIWVLRNPYSVIYSMHYNWGRFSFNELFQACGYSMMPEEQRVRYDKYGKLGVSRIERACYSYNGKVSQAFEIFKKLGRKKMLVIDYDDLINDKHILLPLIYKFIHLDYKEDYSNKIHNRSVGKLNKLSEKEKDVIKNISFPLYEKVKTELVRY